MRVDILYDLEKCRVIGVFPQLREALTYSHRSIDQEARGRPIINTPTTLWQNDDTWHGRETFTTDPGLVEYIRACCIEHRHDPIVQEVGTRLLPFPRIDRMHSLRFSQPSLLIAALTQQRSGIIEAPTRFGKSSMILNTLRAFPGVRTVVTAPGVDLLRQLQHEIKAACPERRVTGLFSGSDKRFQGEDVTVASVDSLHKCDFLGTKLLLIDEPHVVATAERQKDLRLFTSARRIGFGATITGRFDRADLVTVGLIGPTLAKRTYVEARDEGAVAPIKVLLCRMRFVPTKGDRDIAYRRLVYESKEFHASIARVAAQLPADWQTLLFIRNEKQARGIADVIPDSTIAMAKLLTGAERKEVTAAVKDATITRCICSDIYSQGVTFHEVRALINCAGGGGSISCIQKPGRLAEIRPGKKCGVVIDFLWEPDFSNDETLRNVDPDVAFDLAPNAGWKCVVRDSFARRKVYVEKGYDVSVIDLDGVAAANANNI